MGVDNTWKMGWKDHFLGEGKTLYEVLDKYPASSKVKHLLLSDRRSTIDEELKLDAGEALAK